MCELVHCLTGDGCVFYAVRAKHGRTTHCTSVPDQLCASSTGELLVGCVSYSSFKNETVFLNFSSNTESFYVKTILKFMNRARMWLRTRGQRSILCEKYEKICASNTCFNTKLKKRRVEQLVDCPEFPRCFVNTTPV